MVSTVKNFQDLLTQSEAMPSADWKMTVIASGDCQAYVVWNEKTSEALVIDPKKGDQETYQKIFSELNSKIKNLTWLAVIDTHTHADHISAAAEIAEALHAPFMMHVHSPTSKAHLRVSQNTSLPSRSGDLQFVLTPGHTPDGLCVTWGPFVFTGDTVLFGDVGRDDLPGGNPSDHYESLQKLKKVLRPEVLVCPGHDNKGGRLSTWATQLKINSSLTQEREPYIKESTEFDAPAPELLKKSLFENFK